jgi:hypothetical protein
VKVEALLPAVPWLGRREALQAGGPGPSGIALHYARFGPRGLDAEVKLHARLLELAVFTRRAEELAPS